MEEGPLLALTLGEVMLRGAAIAAVVIVAVIGLYLLKNKTGSQGWRVRVPWAVHRFFTCMVWLVVKKVPWKPILIWGPWVAMIGGAAFYGIENWRGKRTWEKVEAEVRARGESLVFKDLLPEVPDEENIAKHPAVEPWLRVGRYPTSLETSGIGGLSRNWRNYGRADPDGGEFRDVRRWLTPVDPTLSESEAARQVLDLTARHWAFLDELMEALVNTECRVTYARGDFEEYDTPSTLMLFRIRSARAFERRSFLYSLLERGEECASDVRAIILLAERFRPALTFATHGAGLGCHYAHGSALWEALRLQVLEEEGLRELDCLLGAIDLRADLEVFLKGERCVALDTIDRVKSSRREGQRMLAQVRSWSPSVSSNEWADRFDDLCVRFGPAGWFDLERAKVADTMNPWIEAVASRDFDRIRALPGKIEQEALATEPHRRLELLYGSQFGVLGLKVDRVLRLETRIAMERVAIAMERFRLRQGKYPSERGEVVPEFLAEWPVDATNGEGLGFEVKPDGTPRLFSLGCDGARGTNDDQKWQYTEDEKSEGKSR